MDDIDTQREVFRQLVRDSIAVGRPEDATKSIYYCGYGDLAVDDIFAIIEEEYGGSPLEGVTTFQEEYTSDSFTPLMQELRDWVTAGAGIFTAFQLDREFGFTDREARKTRAKYLSRLITEGLIERVPDRKGTFRTVEPSEKKLVYRKPGEGEKIILPLGIHTLVRLYPGNVCVVAGSFNSGKTAFMLDLMMKNLGIYKVHFFSSAEGAEEMALRLSEFTYEKPERIFEMANIYERTTDFADVIVPGRGNLNIIDYMEVGENAYMVGPWINKIWSKLDGALAFIAIQKKKRAELGRGAEFSAEKARLYISLDNGKARIVKAKTWRSRNDNPNGKIATFTLRGGCEFTLGRMGWHHPGDEE